MATEKGRTLSLEDEQRLLAPIDEYVGGIQEEINALRVDGTDKVTSLTNYIAIVKENANYTKSEKAAIIAKVKEELSQAKAVEEKNKSRIKSLIDDAVNYLNDHYDTEYFNKVAEACAADKEAENKRYEAELADLKKQYETELSRLTESGEFAKAQNPYVNASVQRLHAMCTK